MPRVLPLTASVRFAIPERMQPFALCLHCNLPLNPAKPASIESQAPERIRTWTAAALAFGG